MYKYGARCRAQACIVVKEHVLEEIIEDSKEFLTVREFAAMEPFWAKMRDLYA